MNDLWRLRVSSRQYCFPASLLQTLLHMLPSSRHTHHSESCAARLCLRLTPSSQLKHSISCYKKPKLFCYFLCRVCHFQAFWNSISGFLWASKLIYLLHAVRAIIFTKYSLHPKGCAKQALNPKSELPELDLSEVRKSIQPTRWGLCCGRAL